MNTLKTLKISSFNVHGLARVIRYPEFYEFINSLDIFILLETHTLHKDIDNYIGDFDAFILKWKPAFRDSRFGRGISGYLFGYKKKLKADSIQVHFSETGSLDILTIKTIKEEVTILPLYLREATWLNQFESVENFVTGSQIKNLIVLGDMNVRIGELDQNLELEELNFITHAQNNKQ